MLGPPSHNYSVYMSDLHVVDTLKVGRALSRSICPPGMAATSASSAANPRPAATCPLRAAPLLAGLLLQQWVLMKIVIRTTLM